MEDLQGPLQYYKVTPEKQDGINNYEEAAEFQQSADDWSQYTENIQMDVPTDCK